MEITGRGTRVRIYFGERDRDHGTALWRAMLDGGLVTTDLVEIHRYTAHSHRPEAHSKPDARR